MFPEKKIMISEGSFDT